MPRILRAPRAVPRLPATRPPLRRMVWLVGRLRAGDALTANSVAEQFEISLRTAYRDVDFLRDQLRAPVEYDARQRSYVLTDKTFSLPPVDLSRGELLGLFFAERVVHQYRGTPYEEDLRAALRKIEQSLPKQVTIDPNARDGFLSLDLGPLAAPDPEVFKRVVDAASRQRRLRMTYTSLTRGKTSERTVDPYRVYNLRGDWYLAAFDPRHRAVRDFALHRIQSPMVLDEGFAVQPGFDFAAYMKDAFSIEKGARPLTVAVRFGARPRRAGFASAAGTRQRASRTASTAAASCACRSPAWARSSAGSCSSAPRPRSSRRSRCAARSLRSCARRRGLTATRPWAIRPAGGARDRREADDATGISANCG